MYRKPSSSLYDSYTVLIKLAAKIWSQLFRMLVTGTEKACARERARKWSAASVQVQLYLFEAKYSLQIQRELFQVLDEAWCLEHGWIGQQTCLGEWGTLSQIRKQKTFNRESITVLTQYVMLCSHDCFSNINRAILITFLCFYFS